MCDGRRDCPDGSDEKCVKRCPSASKWFENECDFDLNLSTVSELLDSYTKG